MFDPFGIKPKKKGLFEVITTETERKYFAVA